MTKISIRPASRHIFAIGRDLINDKQSALIELVKNAYDADSEVVTIKISSFKKSQNSPGDDAIKIEIIDSGHGMSLDTVQTKWMVPSTDDKLLRKYSPNNRLMQGRKGLGRYAAAVLGDHLLLESVSNHKKISLDIDWNKFEKFQYLDELSFDITEESVKKNNGTTLIITGYGKFLFDWTEELVTSLFKSLRKLINPFKKGDNFKIQLVFGNFYLKKFENNSYEIQPLEVLDCALYRLRGKIKEVDIEDFIEKNSDINYLLLKILKLKLSQNIKTSIVLDAVYENLWSKRAVIEPVYADVDVDTNKYLYCGEVNFDFRVFDKEPEAIEKIISKGLRGSAEGEKYTIQEARKDITDFSGVGLFRGDFKIRSYGDPGNDWLELDKRRVNDPSVKLGKDQIIGFVNILSEEESKLEENSARNGLKDGPHYNCLKYFLITALEQLENKRFEYREKMGKSRIKSAESIIANALSYSKTFDKLSGKLKQLDIPDNKASSIKQIFIDEEKKREKDIEELSRIIARYQGQVTLGKIASVVLHEGRRPLAYFKNQIPLINNTIQESHFANNHPILKLDLNGVANNGNVLISLFDKIDPLAIKKRGKMEEFSLQKVLEIIINIYIKVLEENNIIVDIRCNADTIFGWKEDFLIIFGNLMDNSVYWLSKYPSSNGKINIQSYLDRDKIVIIYEDNGIGIDEDAIINKRIFEPGYSTKPSGTGLGLAIAGESASRNGYELTAEYNESGAYFRLRQTK